MNTAAKTLALLSLLTVSFQPVLAAEELTVEAPDGEVLPIEAPIHCPPPLELSWQRSDGVTQLHCQTPGGQLHGASVKWYQGRLQSQGEYYEGKRSGVWIDWQVEGCVSTMNYDQGELDGPSQTLCAGYSEEANWLKGKRSGKTRRVVGEKVSEIFYLDNLRNGLEQTWQAGELVEEGHWVNDQREGVWRRQINGEWSEERYHLNQRIEKHTQEASPSRPVFDLSDALWWVRLSPRMDIPVNDEGAFLNQWGFLGGFIFGELGPFLEMGFRLGALMPDEKEEEVLETSFAYEAWTLGGLGWSWLGVSMQLGAGLSSIGPGNWLDPALLVPVQLRAEIPFVDWIGLMLQLRYDHPIAPTDWDPKSKGIDLGFGAQGTLAADLLCQIRFVDGAEMGLAKNAGMYVETGLIGRYLAGSWMLGLTWRMGYTGPI